MSLPTIRRTALISPTPSRSKRRSTGSARPTRLRTAAFVAYDRKACPDLAGMNTVQQAVDALCTRVDHGGCCATVGPEGEFEDIAKAIATLRARHNGHVCICLAPDKPLPLRTG